MKDLNYDGHRKCKFAHILIVNEQAHDVNIHDHT